MTVHILDRWAPTLRPLCLTPQFAAIVVNPRRGTCPGCIALHDLAGIVDRIPEVGR